MKRLLVALFLFAIGFPLATAQKKDTYKVRTVVIDPGHGGAKPGAHGSRSWEKDITLAVAMKFGKLVADNYPDVKIVYTRTSDVDISLAERARIANSNKADLFISIHANSHPTAAPTGVETFVMGLSESNANLEVAKKENADILLEADYKSNEAYKDFDPNSPESYVLLTMFQNEYINKSLNFAQAIQKQYRQNLKTINRGVKQAELFVLYKTAMPSVLTEIGFISNPGEESFMLSAEGQAKIAISLFNAFMAYKASEEGTGRIANPVINIEGYQKPDVATVADKSPTTAPAAPAVQGEGQKPSVAQPVAAASTSQPKVAPIEAAAPEEASAVSPMAERVPADDPQPIVSATSEPEVMVVEPIVESTPAVRTQPTQKPVPTISLAEREPEQPRSEPAPTPRPKVALREPTNTATGASFYTVQFLTSGRKLPSGAAEFENVRTYDYYTKNGVYCYTTGRFATYAEAANYCLHVKEATSFTDAWVTLRKETAPALSASSKPSAEPTAKPAADGVVYRVQFCSSPRLMQVGDPDLHGISDVRSSKSGKLYLYTAGNYSTRAEADRRCSEIHRTTPFRDAFVVGYKNGERINID